MPYFFYDWTMVLLIPGVLLTLFAQYRLTSTFNKYSKIQASSGHTAAQVAETMLRDHGLSTALEQVGGNLTDHYSPKENTLRLSEPIYGSRSIAALGVAAHEVGHAIQEQEGYGPMRLQFAVQPVASLCSSASIPLLILGIVLSFEPLMQIGIIAFAAVVLYYLIMLPVEFDASSRALVALEHTGFLDSDEVPQARKVLRAAALTYVASAFTAIMQLLRLVLLANNSRRRS